MTVEKKQRGRSILELLNSVIHDFTLLSSLLSLMNSMDFVALPAVHLP